MTLKISFTEVRAAQSAVAEAGEQLNTLTRTILGQAGLTHTVMQAPAGRITAETYADLGGGGRALAQALAELQRDLGAVQRTAAEGSDDATRIALSASPLGATAGAVAAGM